MTAGLASSSGAALFPLGRPLHGSLAHGRDRSVPSHHFVYPVDENTQLGAEVAVTRVDPPSKFETIWKVVGAYWGEAPHPTLTAVGVTWLYGFDFEIKVIAELPAT